MRGIASAVFGLLAMTFLSLPVFAEYNVGMEHYRKAWSAYTTQDFARAQEWGERAVRADPSNAHAHALLGDLAYLRHDLTRAKQSWENALRAGPALVSIQGQIAQADMEIQLEGQMEPVRMGSLVVRIPKDAAPSTGSGRTGGPGSERVGAVSVRAEIVEALSQSIAGLEPYFQHRMNRPLTVLVYPREAFYGDSPRSGTVPSLRLPTEVLGLFDGKIRIPAPSGHPEQAVHPSKDDSLTTVLWHEYTHAVVFDLSHGRAPRWLQEGLAQEAETLAKADRPSTSSGRTVNQGERPLESVRAELVEARIPLRAVLGISERPGEAVVLPAGPFYAASHSLVRYLLELKGWDRMRRFLAALGRADTVEEALKKEYGLDLLTLEKKWREWYHSKE